MQWLPPSEEWERSICTDTWNYLQHIWLTVKSERQRVTGRFLPVAHPDLLSTLHSAPCPWRPTSMAHITGLLRPLAAGWLWPVRSPSMDQRQGKWDWVCIPSLLAASLPYVTSPFQVQVATHFLYSYLLVVPLYHNHVFGDQERNCPLIFQTWVCLLFSVMT